MLVIVTFDIHNATSEDYAYVSDRLSAIGLEKEISGDEDFHTSLPNNTYAGEMKDVLDAKGYAKDVVEIIHEIIAERKKKAKVYAVVAPGNWGWASKG